VIRRCLCPNCRIVEALLAEEGVRPAGVMELGTTEAVKQAVAADLGVSLLSRHVLELDLASGAIVAVPFAGGEPSRDLYLVYHKDRYLSQAARAFFEMLAWNKKFDRRAD
jgi:DNA-binding transcriptional LysR family regulator